MVKMTIEKALELLELEGFASISDVKRAYRDMARKYHPDKCAEKHKKDCEEKFKNILEAKTLLIEYCENYPIPFTKDAVQREVLNNDLVNHYQQFYSDWFGDIKK